MTGYETIPMSNLLKNRDIFRIFDTEFQEVGWLDASVLLASDSTIKDLYADETVPKQVLDKIVERLNTLIQ